MKIAVPVENGRLTTHFGRTAEVMMLTIEDASSRICGEQALETPPHEPGRFPAWLREQGADVVIAGGMGPRALALFAQAGVRVILGAPCLPPRDLAAAFLAGELHHAANACNHGPEHHCRH